MCSLPRQSWEVSSFLSGYSSEYSSNACSTDNGSVTWQESTKSCSLLNAKDNDVKGESDSESLYNIPPFGSLDHDTTDEVSDTERSVDAVAEEHIAAATSAAIHDAELEGGPGVAQGDNVAASEARRQELKIMRKEIQSNFTMLMGRFDHLCAAISVATTQTDAVATIAATGQDTGTQKCRQDGPAASIWAEEVIVRGKQVVVEDEGAWKYGTIVLFFIATLWITLEMTLDG